MEKPAASQSEDVSRAQRRMLTAQVILTRAASSGKESSLARSLRDARAGT
jgi:hypothetical protein